MERFAAKSASTASETTPEFSLPPYGKEGICVASFQSHRVSDAPVFVVANDVLLNVFATPKSKSSVQLEGSGSRVILFGSFGQLEWVALVVALLLLIVGRLARWWRLAHSRASGETEKKIRENVRFSANSAPISPPLRRHSCSMEAACSMHEMTVSADGVRQRLKRYAAKSQRMIRSPAAPEESVFRKLSLQLKRSVSQITSDTTSDCEPCLGEIVLQNGKLARTFDCVRVIDARDPSVYCGLHKFERKWYAIKRISLSTQQLAQFHNSALYSYIVKLTTLQSSQIASYITFWAEKDADKENSLGANIFDDDELSCSRTLERSWSSPQLGEEPTRERAKTEAGCDESRYSLFVQMEDCGKNGLATYLQEQRLLNNEAFAVFKRVLKALEFLESKNIAHGALRPENVFLCESGVKLANLSFLRAELSSMETVLGAATEVQPLVHSDSFDLGLLLFSLLDLQEVVDFEAKLDALREQNFDEEISERSEAIKLALALTHPDARQRPAIKDVQNLEVFANWSSLVSISLHKEEHRLLV